MGKKFKTTFIVLILLVILFFIINLIYYSPFIAKKETTQQGIIDELIGKIENMEKEFSHYREKNKELDQELNNLKHLISMDRILIEEQVKIINNKDNWRFKQDNLIFPIYTSNWFNGNREILFYTSLSKDSSLEEQLNLVGYKLSQYCFGGLSIDLVEIKEIGNKKVAMINLKENDDELWVTTYFQGSSGGNITSTQLIETFLQRDYWGKWIDGVEFLYENSKVDFDHVEDLHDINYR